MNKVRLYPQLELLNTWAIDRTRFSPDATEPPLCLRCGRPLNPVLSRNGAILVLFPNLVMFIPNLMYG